MLASLCDATRQPSHADEPACRVRETLGEDDAWLTLWNACRASAEAMMPPCPAFRHEAGGVLIYHAEEGTWDAQWEGRAWPLTFDVAGTPTLRMKPRDSQRLHIVVDEISPITYAASAGTPKEQDIALMPGLETLLGVAGASMQNAISSFTASRPADAARPPAAPETPAPACAPDATPIASQVRAHAAAADALTGGLDRLSEALGALEQQQGAFTGLLQKADRGEPVTRAEFVRPDSTALDRAAAAVETSAATLFTVSRELASCDALTTAYTVLLGGAGASAALPTLVEQVFAASGTCRNPVLKDSLVADARALATCAATTPDAVKARVLAIAPYVTLLKDAIRDDSLVIDAAKLREVIPAARTAASALAAEIDRAERHTWRGALVRQLVVSRPNPALGWNKVQSHSIVLAADTPYAKQIVLAHAKQESHPYRIASAAGELLGYGVGVVYTPLHETTWTAAAAPNGRGKLIVEHQRTSRSGDLAAFLSYRVLEHWPRQSASWIEPTADAGVGLTTGTLAFFLGGGIELFHGVHLSAGWSPQRVTVLAPGQLAGVTPVSSADDIRTIDRFATHNWYLSFSFALDSASLFHGGR
jgi:hypothetical protein